jgi:hypothetical protein
MVADDPARVERSEVAPRGPEHIKQSIVPRTYLEVIVMTQQSTTQSGAVPARVDLEDFIEAVSRGVARALAAQQEEVSGYAFSVPVKQPPIVIGLWLPPPLETSLTSPAPTIESR